MEFPKEPIEEFPEEDIGKHSLILLKDNKPLTLAEALQRGPQQAEQTHTNEHWCIEMLIDVKRGLLVGH